MPSFSSYLLLTLNVRVALRFSKCLMIPKKDNLWESRHLHISMKTLNYQELLSEIT